MNHTKEPWFFSEKYGEICYKSSDDDQSYGMSCPVVICKQNARRIVACVNACAGLETEELEQFSASSLRDGIALIQMRKQRDELLATMQQAADEIRRCDYTPARSTLLTKIARMKGTAK